GRRRARAWTMLGLPPQSVEKKLLLVAKPCGCLNVPKLMVEEKCCLEMVPGKRVVHVSDSRAVAASWLRDESKKKGHDVEHAQEHRHQSHRNPFDATTPLFRFLQFSPSSFRRPRGLLPGHIQMHPTPHCTLRSGPHLPSDSQEFGFSASMRVGDPSLFLCLLPPLLPPSL
ncbi:hypothetical protein TcCL_ESM09130, partial [Trypanosoma cruzi]